MNGYILIHRQITENEFYFSERFTKIMAWIDLLLIANHSGNTFYLRGVKVTIKPGELSYSIRTLARRWKWNERTVMKYLAMLEAREMIEIQKSNVTNIVKILKWDEFQRPFIKNSKTRKNTTQKKQANKGLEGNFNNDNTTQSTTQNTTQNTTEQIMYKEGIKENSISLSVTILKKSESISLLNPVSVDTVTLPKRDLNLLTEKESKMLTSDFEAELWRDVTEYNLMYIANIKKWEWALRSFIYGMMKLKPDEIPARQKYIMLILILYKHKEKILNEGISKDVKSFIGNDFKNYFISDYKKLFTEPKQTFIYKHNPLPY
jgi:DNA-binding transcriptional regulator YhcF (GntR family)